MTQASAVSSRHMGQGFLEFGECNHGLCGGNDMMYIHIYIYVCRCMRWWQGFVLTLAHITVQIVIQVPIHVSFGEQ